MVEVKNEKKWLNIMKVKTVKGDWMVFLTNIMLNYLIIRFDWWIVDYLISQNSTLCFLDYYQKKYFV